MAGEGQGVVVEGHRAQGGGRATIDLSRVPHLAESLTGGWPHDQQVQFGAACSQLGLALSAWIPGLEDEIVRERLARAFAWQALYGMRRKMNMRGLVEDDEIREDLRHIATTEGRHPD